MVGLILFILSFIRRERIIQVRRTLPVKNLRAHLLGLTIGLILTSLNLLFDLNTANLWLSVTLFIWFALVTYFGGLLFTFTILAYGVVWVIAPPLRSVEFMVNAQWYGFGYVGGALFALFYNDLLFLYLRFSEDKNIKIAFAYDRQRHLNIIKSPIAAEEHAMNQLLIDQPDLSKQRLYRYRLPSAPARPYTIAFVANPQIRQRGGDENNNSGYRRDPIIQDLDLFLRAVDRALFSFEQDPVIGRPEIWSRIRVLTIFRPELATASGPEYGMVEEFQGELTDSTGAAIENSIISPMRRMIENPGDTGNFMRLLTEARRDDDPAFVPSDIDVIFALTASPTHDRGSAFYSDFIELGTEGDRLRNAPGRSGVCFAFDIDPCRTKENYQNGNPVEPVRHVFPDLRRDEAHATFRKLHDYTATRPGRVALNVLSARLKSYRHEFAHAMSSFFHGTIKDEYSDYFHVPGEPFTQIPHFSANRIERSAAAMPIPVPKVFAAYHCSHLTSETIPPPHDPTHMTCPPINNCTHYPVDVSHPSAEEFWHGYFPARHDRRTPCTMDYDYGSFRFDELLSMFIYDRLMVKVNRPR